ncbi:MAG: DUF5103 domain-containing protein, partial [Prevotella sp.]|nr:DUF5103 domain-containing protein [Prevotella sp.]
KSRMKDFLEIGMKIFMIVILHSSLFNLHLSAQRHIVYSDDIRSLQVVAGSRWMDLPIVTMGSGERVNISFDELSHEYHRYIYRVRKLDRDWKESEGVFPPDFLDGVRSEMVIEDYLESINTTQDYTHYRVQIPNDQCRLKMSGNYRVDVYDNDADNEDAKVLSAFFLVNEDVTNVGFNCSGDTDIDLRRSHQQLTVKADHQKLKATDPLNQVKGYVVQNNRWDNMLLLPTPTSFNQQFMEWNHCKDLIYDGGNEFHKFEILDIHRNSFNVDSKSWDKENEIWHVYAQPDEKRPSYSYDETPKGAFLIRNSDNRESNTTSEYVMVHFTLLTPEPFPYPVYVDGMWAVRNGDKYWNEAYRMTYDKEQKAYTCAVPLKYGYYSYQYLMVKPDGTAAIPPTEGSFYETKNLYTLLFYFRGLLDRTDRLVGVK